MNAIICEVNELNVIYSLIVDRLMCNTKKLLSVIIDGFKQ